MPCECRRPAQKSLQPSANDFQIPCGFPEKVLVRAIPDGSRGRGFEPHASTEKSPIRCQKLLAGRATKIWFAAYLPPIRTKRHRKTAPAELGANLLTSIFASGRFARPGRPRGLLCVRPLSRGQLRDLARGCLVCAQPGVLSAHPQSGDPPSRGQECEG